MYGAETWALRRGHKYMDIFEMWCWRRMEKISWTDLWEMRSITWNKGGEEYPTQITKR